MEREKLKQILEDLRNFSHDFNSATSKIVKENIADVVRNYASHFPDELYVTLNDGNGSGLFEYGFFESDLKKPYQKFRNYAKSNQDDNLWNNETWLYLLKLISCITT